ncbi:MAG: alpha-glucan family phosphorylase [archaeon]
MEKTIAYFSMEIGFHEHIPTYSGGLGVLAGDTIKSFADLEVPAVALTILSKKGYFYQKLDLDGNQKELPVEWSVEDFMTLLPQKVPVKIEGRDVFVQCWLHQVEGITGHKIPVYYLDTDVPENSQNDREITGYLYGGDEKYRLFQEAILGIGGVRILNAVGHTKLLKYHMNEGHSAFLTLELLKENNNNTEIVRNKCVFTTHTPVPAGHDRFDINIAKSVLGDMIPDFLLQEIVDKENKLNMTLIALHLSKYINGVAKMHGEISRMMFPHFHIDSITNGIHTRSWASPAIKRVFDKHIPGWTNDPYSLRYIAGINKKEIWDAHFESKKILIDFVNERENAGLDYNYFTIGYARRMTSYKRPDLIFYDINRLIELSKKYKIQLILSGKAHPKDYDGKDKIKQIFSITKQLANNIKITYIENYDIAVAKKIVAGVDIWLNTPLRPREASGTSGMKASLNGVPQLSVLDGWWIEGHIENITGWSIGPMPKKDEMESPSESMADAKDLYDKLEKVILPLYYNDKENWMRKMRSSISINASFFNTHRMVSQYITNAYFR